MKKMILITCVLLFSVNFAAAFETHGLRSGMTQDQAKSALEKHWCGKIDMRWNRIVAYPESPVDPLLILNFKRGGLYRFQKRCLPGYDYFTQLVADKRKEFGRPVDVWVEPTNLTSTNDSNCIHFRWNNGKHTCRVSYSHNDPNSWLTITYEDKV